MQDSSQRLKESRLLGYGKFRKDPGQSLTWIHGYTTRLCRRFPTLGTTLSVLYRCYRGWDESHHGNDQPAALYHRQRNRGGRELSGPPAASTGNCRVWPRELALCVSTGARYNDGFVNNFVWEFRKTTLQVRISRVSPPIPSSRAACRASWHFGAEPA